MRKELLELAHNRAETAGLLALAHGMAADRTEALSRWLGVPVVVLTAIVGTSVFASLSDLGKSQVAVAVITGALSLLATALSSMQTFLNFAGRAEAHKRAGARFNALRSSLERLRFTEDQTELQESVGKLDKQFAEIFDESPRASLALQEKARQSMAQNSYIHSSSRELYRGSYKSQRMSDLYRTSKKS
jgi:mannose/fructose-specific phosphotransferase system component IIA